MFITYLQIQGLMISVHIPWPSEITNFFIAMGSIINFDIWGMISPQCSVEMSFEATWMVRLISPVAILTPVAIGITWYSYKPGKADLADKAFSTVIQVLHMMFVGTTVHTLTPFDCVEYEPVVAEGEGAQDALVVMDRTAEIMCDYEDPTYQRMAIAGAIGLGIYTFIYFFFVASTLWKIRVLNKRHATYVPPPGTLGHPDFRRAKRRKKKSDEDAFDGEVAYEPPPDAATEEVVLEIADGKQSASEAEAKKSEAGDATAAVVRERMLEKRFFGRWTSNKSAADAKKDAAQKSAAPADADAEDTSGASGESRGSESRRESVDGPGPVTESAEGADAIADAPKPDAPKKSSSIFGSWGSSKKAAAGAKKNEDDAGNEGKEGDDADDEDSDDEDEHAIIIARLHPDLQVQVVRYGLLCLPFAQRTWYWELLSMLNKLFMSMFATFLSRTPKVQMQMMLAQNMVWFALIFFFKPYCAIPFKGARWRSFSPTSAPATRPALVRGEHRGGGNGARLGVRRRDGRRRRGG